MRRTSGIRIPQRGFVPNGKTVHLPLESGVLVLLDTTVLIDILRGRPEAIQRLAHLRRRGDRVITSPINVDEIVRGVRPDEQAVVDRLFAGIEVVPIQLSEGVASGNWRRDFASRGTTLSQADCLIAAVAVSHSAQLATGNPKDFPMPDLEIDHWPVGK